MNRRDRQRQKKKKDRQERLRQEKRVQHQQPSLPRPKEGDDAGFVVQEPAGPYPPVMPSRFNMERTQHDLARAIEERGIQSDEELHQFLEEYNRGQGPRWIPGDPGRADVGSKAQELAYQAMEAQDLEESARLARAALYLDPECVDALATLAGVTAGSNTELIAGLQEAVALGERALGAEFFEANRGRFWGIVQTRPYMRTRTHLAELLRLAGRLPEAIAHYEAMLELNPNDNPGNRDPLLGCYLAAGNLEGARRLFEKYGASGMAVFTWGRVLERYLSGDLAGAAAALTKARAANAHVEPYLTGARPMPAERPDYYQPGKASEAIRVVDFLLAAWRRHPAALHWLRTGKAPDGSGEAAPPSPALTNYFVGPPAQAWLDALLAGTDTNPIVRALEVDLVPAELLLRDSVCCEVLVAAELVAAARGRPSRHLPPRVRDWLVAQDLTVSPGVVQLAREAVGRVGRHSELRQLWDTVRLAPEWLRGVEDLQQRLQG